MDFKKGSKVVFVEYSKDSMWAAWAKDECLKPGGIYTVGNVSSKESHDGVNVGLEIEGKGRGLWQCSSQFKLKVDIVNVILRRPSNWPVVAKVLDEAGYSWLHSGDMLNQSPYDRGSRLLHIDLRIKKCWYASISGSKRLRPKQIIEKHTDTMQDTEKSGTQWVFINTKPSVNEAINELKMYI